MLNKIQKREPTVRKCVGRKIPVRKVLPPKAGVPAPVTPTEPQLIDRIDYASLPEAFKAGEGWGMRTSGEHVLGLVNYEGKWTMPPIKCKSYIDDAIGCRLTGFTSYSACGYKVNPQDLKGKRQALVVGAYPGLEEKVFSALNKGLEFFQSVTGNMFSPAKLTSGEERTISWYWRQNLHSKVSETNPLIKFKFILVEYDERIEFSPVMHSLFITCIRGAPTAEYKLCPSDAEACAVLTKNKHYADGLAFIKKNHPATEEAGALFCSTFFPSQVHGTAGFRNFSKSLAYDTYKTHISKLYGDK